jgi:hypothetical protein
MFFRVLKFVRLPILLLAIFTIARFSLGVAGVPYAPRGNAMFSIVGLMLVSSFYFGALSAQIGKFTWSGTILVGIIVCFTAEALVLLATWISYAGNLNTYFIHWDALNVPPGTSVPFGNAMMARTRGLIAGPVLGIMSASLGRVLYKLAPRP